MVFSLVCFIFVKNSYWHLSYLHRLVFHFLYILIKILMNDAGPVIQWSMTDLLGGYLGMPLSWIDCRDLTLHVEIGIKLQKKKNRFVILWLLVRLWMDTTSICFDFTGQCFSWSTYQDNWEWIKEHTHSQQGVCTTWHSVPPGSRNPRSQ